MPINRKIAFYIYFTGLFGLSASIPVSKFGTSFGMILISFAWFLNWNWKEKLSLLKEHRIPLIASVSLFLIFVFGLIHSENIDYALKDLKIKAPLFILPVVFALSGFKLDRERIIVALIILTSSGVIASIIGYISYYIRTTQGEILDLRCMSPFISMIRLSLILSFGFGLGLWGFSKLKSNLKWLLLVPIGWIVYFIVCAESLTGLVLIPVLSLYFMFFILKRNRTLAFGLGAILLISSIWLAFKLTDISSLVFANNSYKYNEKTLNGRKYKHNIKVLTRENGNLLYDNLNEEEMLKEWSLRSSLRYNDTINGFNVGAVLIRFLTSKGISKDSVGVSLLTNDEIKAVERGVPNVYYLTANPIARRIHVGFMEIRNAIENKKYFGSSIASRYIYARTGYQIFKDNFLFGTGTGDVKDEFLDKYKKLNTKEVYFDKRSHNQYLTVAITLGIFGLIIFVGIISLLMKTYNGTLIYIFFLGQLILLLGMLWEDTLETQAGIAIFSLLLNLFLFEKKYN